MALFLGTVLGRAAEQIVADRMLGIPEFRTNFVSRKTHPTTFAELPALWSVSRYRRVVGNTQT